MKYKNQRTHYDKAFKENAVKLSFERKNESELAQELGIEPPLCFTVGGRSVSVSAIPYWNNCPIYEMDVIQALSTGKPNQAT